MIALVIAGNFEEYKYFTRRYGLNTTDYRIYRGGIMNCLFCGFPEAGYRPEPDKEFICSTCVQLFISTDQSELKRAYNKAREKGFQNKAEAIESFLITEEKINEQRKPIYKKHRRHIDRKRINRTIGNQKKRIGRS